MGLNWYDFAAIAEELNECFPDRDLVNLEEEALRQMVISLPEFEGGAFPEDHDLLGAILSVWIEVASEDGGHTETEADAWA